MNNSKSESKLKSKSIRNKKIIKEITNQLDNQLDEYNADHSNIDEKNSDDEIDSFKLITDINITGGGTRLFSEFSDNESINSINSINSGNLSDFFPIKGGGVMMINRNCEDRKKDLLFQIKLNIIEKMLKHSKYISILGLWAHKIWKYDMKFPCIINEPIQISSTLNISHILQMLKKICGVFGTFKITQGYPHYLSIPKEYRLTKTSINIDLRGKKEQKLIEYYNIMEYKSIPCYHHNHYTFFDKYYSLMFMFIYIWNLTDMYTNDHIKEERYCESMKKLLEVIIQIEKDFPISNSIMGIDLDSDEERKIKTLGVNNKIYNPYIPALYEKKNGKLRII